MYGELKPCPFCGNEPQEITLNGKPLVVCWGRDCANDPKNWNNRPIEDALTARIAELESLVDQLIWVGNDLLVSNTNPVTITLFNGLVNKRKE